MICGQDNECTVGRFKEQGEANPDQKEAMLIKNASNPFLLSDFTTSLYTFDIHVSCQSKDGFVCTFYAVPWVIESYSPP